VPRLISEVPDFDMFINVNCISPIAFKLCERKLCPSAFPSKIRCHETLSFHSTKVETIESCSWTSCSTSCDGDIDDDFWTSYEASDVQFPNRSMCYQDLPLCFVSDIEEFVGDMSDDGSESILDDSDVKSYQAPDVPFPNRSMCYQDLPLCFVSDIEEFVGDMSDDGPESFVDDSDVKSYDAPDVPFPNRSMCYQDLPLFCF